MKLHSRPAAARESGLGCCSNACRDNFPICLASPLLVLGLVLAIHSGPLAAQVEDSRIFPADEHDPDEPKILEAAQVLRGANAGLDIQAAKGQLSRASCELQLPPSRREKLAGRAIWQTARRSHVRIGWYRLCTNCDKWHLRLAGGYVISADGAVATCQHVVRPDEKAMREGYLLAADDDGRVFAVTEVLAANEKADVAIVRVKAQGLTPLPLNTDVAPGDAVWCYSEPQGRRGYFSQGIVNRLVGRGRDPAPDGPLALNVSTDWAPGSSGSALLDECGNAIGHVCQVSPLADSKKGGGTLMVVREAASARDVLRLVKAKP